jgi:hypothetical protein
MVSPASADSVGIMATRQSEHNRLTLVFVLTVVLGIVSGCGEKESLPPPGSEGLVVVHWWDEQGGLPAYLQAERVMQKGSKFEELEFITVLMRLPGRGGVVYVSAPRAHYQRDAKEEVVLSALKDQPVDGPVRFLGTFDGDVFIGRADRAVFEETTRRMRLENVEMVYQGLRERTTYVEIGEEREIPYGKLERMSNAPALTAALGALPSPLVLPPVRIAGEKPTHKTRTSNQSIK